MSHNTQRHCFIVIIIFFVIFHTSLSSLIVDVQAWEKTLDDGTVQTVYLCGDVHKTINPNTGATLFDDWQEQQEQLLTMFTESPNTLVLLEDPNDDLATYWQKRDPRLALNLPPQCLALASLCKERNIAINNVEFRAPFRCSSVDVTQKKIDQFYHTRKQSATDQQQINTAHIDYPLSDITTSIDDNLAYISSIKAHETLAPEYETQIEQFCKNHAAYHFLHNAAQKPHLTYLFDALVEYFGDDVSDISVCNAFIKALFDQTMISHFDSPIIDFKILREIDEASHTQPSQTPPENIFVATGYYHTNHIAASLKKLDYEQVARYGGTFAQKVADLESAYQDEISTFFTSVHCDSISAPEFIKQYEQLKNRFMSDYCKAVRSCPEQIFTQDADTINRTFFLSWLGNHTS